MCYNLMCLSITVWPIMYKEFILLNGHYSNQPLATIAIAIHCTVMTSVQSQSSYNCHCVSKPSLVCTRNEMHLLLTTIKQYLHTVTSVEWLTLCEYHINLYSS